MRLLSKRQVLDLVPVSHTTLKRWEDQGRFPARKHFGGKGKWSKAFWKEAEVQQWIETNFGADEPATSS